MTTFWKMWFIVGGILALFCTIGYFFIENYDAAIWALNTSLLSFLVARKITD